MTPTEQDDELEEKIYALDRLREKIDPNMPKIGSVMARVDDIVALITTREKRAEGRGRIDELERIDAANIDNGINFWFAHLKKQDSIENNNGWRTMRQYTPERIAELKAQQEEV